MMVIGSFPKISCRLVPSYPPGNPVSTSFPNFGTVPKIDTDFQQFCQSKKAAAQVETCTGSLLGLIVDVIRLTFEVTTKTSQKNEDNKKA